LMLFWMVVILGYRRQRNFERVFFFLCLALFFFYAGSLLALNAELHYANPPNALMIFSELLVVVGLWALPATLLQLNVEYADSRGYFATRVERRVWSLIAVVPLVCSYIYNRASPGTTGKFDFLTPVNSFPLHYRLWLFFVLILCAYW